MNHTESLNKGMHAILEHIVYLHSEKSNFDLTFHRKAILIGCRHRDGSSYTKTILLWNRIISIWNYSGNIKMRMKTEYLIHSVCFGQYYNYVIMDTMTSQITSLTIFYSNVCLGADKRKHRSSPSLAFVWGIHWWQRHSILRRHLLRIYVCIENHPIGPIWATRLQKEMPQ